MAKRRNRGSDLELSQLIAIVVVLAVIFFLRWIAKGYNLPGQNVVSKVLVMLILAYQAHNLRMYYARNVILGILVFYLPSLAQHAEEGSYDPRSYLSLLMQTMIAVGMINIIARFAGLLFA